MLHGISIGGFSKIIGKSAIVQADRHRSTFALKPNQPEPGWSGGFGGHKKEMKMSSIVDTAARTDRTGSVGADVIVDLIPKAVTPDRCAPSRASRLR